MVGTENLIQVFESSLNHANTNYQMIALETIAKYENGASHQVVSEALSRLHPERKPSFFNKTHRVFEALKNKGIIKVRQDKQETVYTLNIRNPTQEDRKLVRKAAIKARKAFEVKN